MHPLPEHGKYADVSANPSQTQVSRDRAQFSQIEEIRAGRRCYQSLQARADATRRFDPNVGKREQGKEKLAID